MGFARRLAVSDAEVEGDIGIPTILNTSRPGDRDKLLYYDIDLDPERDGPVPRLMKASEVVSWQRPGSWRNPHLVGVMWDAEYRPSVFFDILLPP